MSDSRFKFRLWDGDEMLYPKSWLELVHIAGDSLDYTTLFEDDVIMQWTGITVRGVNLYEGDIVQYAKCNEDDNLDLRELGDSKGVVIFEDGTFKFNDLNERRNRQWSDGTHDWETIENVEWYHALILGNIYENKDLL